MKIAIVLVLLAGFAGCAHQQTRTDSAAASPVPPAAGTPGPSKIDRSGTVEQQLARLQDAYDRNAEAIEFLNKVYAQQKAEQAAEEREEPAPEAVFAVDIAPNVKLGMVEGSPQALVTIVEAWDFA